MNLHRPNVRQDFRANFFANNPLNKLVNQARGFDKVKAGKRYVAI